MAARPRTSTRRASSHPPLWLVEGADIVRRKTVLLGVVTGAVVLIVAVVAWLAPSVIPPTATVGAAVGLAALLMGLAAAVTSDAADLVVRGPRHVAAAGGELVAVLPRDPSVAAAGPLAQAVLEVRQSDVPLLLSFASAGRDARRSAGWTSALARALLAEGVSVLRLDLSSGRSDTPGLVEVIRDGSRLADVVSFEPGVKLAEMTAGRDHAQALEALTELPARLPRDLDILLVALPSATARTVVSAAASLDHVLVVVERDRTSRVDLIASLEALETAGTHAQVILLDTPTSSWLAPPVVVPADAEVARPSGLASTIGAAPVLREGSDGEPVPVPADADIEDVDHADVEDEVDDGPAAAHEPAAEPVLGHDASTEVEHPGPEGAEHDADAEPLLLSEDASTEVEDAPAGAAADDADASTEVEDPGPEVEASDVDTGRIAPVEDGDGGPELRDTAVLDAAAAATALSIAASQQGLTQEQQPARAPDAPEDQPIGGSSEDVATDDTTDEPSVTDDPSAPADAPAEPAAPAEDEQPVLEAVEGPMDRPAADPVPDREPVIELDLDEAADAGAMEVPTDGDPTNDVPTDAEPTDGDPTNAVPTDAEPTDSEPSDGDPTDQLAPVRDVGPLAGRDRDAEDLLRTTAQLAILTEDMQARLRAEGGGSEADEG